MSSRKPVSKKSIILGSILSIVFFNFWAILCLTLIRFLFFKLYSANESFSLNELIKSLWLGIRFDQTAVSYFNFIFFCIVFTYRYTRLNPDNLHKKLIQLTAVSIGFISFIHIANVYYYGYFQDHFNFLIYGFIHDDTVAVLQTMWTNYPVIKILFAIAVIYILSKKLYDFLFNYFTKKIETLNSFKLKKTEALFFVIVFISNFILARGSLGLFPLGVHDTVISKNNFINQLSYNGSHALIKTLQLRNQNNKNKWDSNAEYYGYKNNLKKAASVYFNISEDQVPANPLDLLVRKTPKNNWAEKTKPHVVLIVMESFGAYWLRFHTPSFNLLGELEKHIKEDFITTNFLPATGATIGSIAALMINSPHRPDNAFLTEGEYLNVRFKSSPAQTYKNYGYETNFIYGGNTGWRDIGKFAMTQGFDKVESQVDIEESLNRKIEKHDWGIYDEDLFEHIKIKLQRAKKPQFILALTTTNHPPYELPSSYKALEQKMPLDLSQKIIGDHDIAASRFLVYQYSNQKLGEFLGAVKNSDLKDKTIVAATGDHSFYLIQFDDKQILEKWSVPFYMYVPKAGKKNIDPNIYASYTDIIPTLYDLSLSEASYESLSFSLLDPARPNLAIFFSRFTIDPNGVCFAGPPGGENYLILKNDPQQNVTELNNKLKRSCQVYGSGIAIQDFYFKSQRK